MADMPPTIRGFDVFECLSALQKAIRRGDEPVAVTMAVELDQSGYAKMLWNRLLVIMVEDVGIAEPNLPATIHALHVEWQAALDRAKPPKFPHRLFLMNAVLLLVRAKKSRMVDNAVWATYGVEEPLVKEIPDYALDGHTKRGASMGRGRTQGTRPDSFHLENEADLGPNPYMERKEAYRAAVGMEHSRKVFGRQGRGSFTPSRPAPDPDAFPERGEDPLF